MEFSHVNNLIPLCVEVSLNGVSHLLDNRIVNNVMANNEHNWKWMSDTSDAEKLSPFITDQMEKTNPAER